jgi:hypothetical protein
MDALIRSNKRKRAFTIPRKKSHTDSQEEFPNYGRQAPSPAPGLLPISENLFENRFRR